jgi:hypothetical protein
VILRDEERSWIGKGGIEGQGGREVVGVFVVSSMLPDRVGVLCRMVDAS